MLTLHIPAWVIFYTQTHTDVFYCPKHKHTWILVCFLLISEIRSLFVSCVHVGERLFSRLFSLKICKIAWWKYNFPIYEFISWSFKHSQNIIIHFVTSQMHTQTNWCKYSSCKHFQIFTVIFYQGPLMHIASSGHASRFLKENGHT